MNLLDRIRRIDRIDQLIRMKATGSPRELASRLEVSERTVYELINEMRQLGADIFFCPDSQSYRYRQEVRFQFGFQLQELEEYNNHKKFN